MHVGSSWKALSACYKKGEVSLGGAGTSKPSVQYGLTFR